ncbi:hypothetical protein ACLMAJ_12455 [Nocardia sp. KC 131]|uniref:hypothetical protein n=1 Tax=Nocardia arseniciresistens TaxID=3392119 RepID=UPI00398E70AC
MNRSPVSPDVRMARALMFAAIAVLLSTIGHAEISEHAVPLSALVLAFAATGALAWALADRQRGILAIGGGLLTMQAALHMWFGVSSMSGGHGSSHAAATAAESAATPAMIAGHCSAALACALWLWVGERALFALLSTLYTRTVAPLLLALIHPVVIDIGTCLSVVVDRRVSPLHDLLLRYVMAQRGPPVDAISC